MKNELIVVIGAFGSGKSEYSINLSKYLKDNKKDNVTLIDLDVVNPFFRSRYIRSYFSDINIEVISPDFKYGHADVPMISPRIMGAINDYNKTVIIDTGGDPTGCRALARFYEQILTRGYSMHFVVNTKRPFTNNFDNIIEMKKMLENVSHLKISEIICNTNLMQLTTVNIIEEGIKILLEVASHEKLNFNKYLVLKENGNKFPKKILNINKFVMNYYLSKPWESNVFGNSFC
jgi:tRNA uridine 5-carbamoylmethylation protein Kti12